MLAIRKKKLAELKANIAQQIRPTPHYTAGQVMCFMMPKQIVFPTVMVNKYGKLAHDVFEESEFGSCIMQDGSVDTFSYTVIWAGVERMGDEKFRCRCPKARLERWFTNRRADQSSLDRDIRESEQRYKDKLQVQISNTSSPDSTESATSPPPPEAKLVLIHQGEHICLLKTKHEPVFGIVAHNVTDDMSHAACIMWFPERGRPPIYEKIKLGKLQKAVERMTLNVYKALCPSGALNALLASEQRDAVAMLGKIAKCQMGGTKEAEDGKVSIEPSTTDQPPASGNFTADDVLGDVTTALNPDTTTDPELDILIDDGTFVCFQKKNKPTTCGVLVHDVTKDNQSGTCLMMDMTYEGLGYDTFPLRTLEQGVKEMTRLPYHKQVLIMNHLKDYLRKERTDEEAMNQCVADSLRSYEKRARKSVGSSLNKPVVEDVSVNVTADAAMIGQGTRPLQNDPVHNNAVVGAARQHTLSNTDNPANNKAPVMGGIESPKYVNPVSEGY